MRLLILFFVFANFALAVGVTRRRHTPLVPAVVSFAEFGQRISQIGLTSPPPDTNGACGISCLPQSPAGSVCAPLATDPSAYPCDTCQDPGAFGCCFVTGYYPNLCTANQQTDACLSAADSMSRNRSEACTTVVTCQPSCGNESVTIPGPTGPIVLCTYDTCLGETGCPPPAPPAACVMGPWSDWGNCLQSTGAPVTCARPTGLQYRTRNASDPSACFDPTDNPTQQSQSCAILASECLVNCHQTPYTTYTKCPACWNRTLSNSPPTAYNYSTYSVWGLVPGAVCDCPMRVTTISPTLCLKPVVCSTIPICPQNCVASAWGPWSACDKSCADYQQGFCQTCTGVQTRTRSIVTQAEFGGLQCGPLTQSQSCNTQQCPIPCLMSTWSTWSQCTAECGGGQTQRTRYAITSPQFGGAPCGSPLQIQVCNNVSCPVSCSVGEWGVWSNACPTCVPDDGSSPGSKTRTRLVTVPPENGGTSCPSTIQTVSCPYNYCPVNCELSAWDAWTPCTQTCGGGVQSRDREVAIAAGYGGLDCTGNMTQTQTCNTQCCPVDCVWYWSVWSSPLNSSQDCTVHCGGGTQVRSVVVVVPPACGGTACGTQKPSDAVQPCNTAPCSVNCNVSDWDLTVADCVNLTNPSYCSATCGLGWCVRRRTITTLPQFGGAMCPLLEDWIACNNGPCKQPCEYSSWGSWSLCSGTCGAGGSFQVRNRTLLNPSEVAPNQCTDVFQQSACDANPCPVNCIVGAWTDWSPCAVTCGLGQQMRSRSNINPLYGGQLCPPSVEIDFCDMGDCPVPCVVSEWDAWSPCPVTCSDPSVSYYQTHQRVIILNGTDGCDLPLSETSSSPCGSVPCPVNCELSNWGPWSPCSGCGLQQQSRSRNITTAPLNGGRICQVTNQYQLCDGIDGPCIVPCTFSPWSDWGPCSKSCGEGSHSRNRYLLEYSSNEDSCPTLTNQEPCFDAPCCPVDCKFTYSAWGPCSPQGYRRRTVTITQNVACGGAPCPTCLVERDDCIPADDDDTCWLEDCDDASPSSSGSPF